MLEMQDTSAVFEYEKGDISYNKYVARVIQNSDLDATVGPPYDSDIVQGWSGLKLPERGPMSEVYLGFLRT